MPDAGRKPSPGGTRYYIDPISGDDGNSGTGADSPWRTLAPVNQLILAPGDHVEIMTPGAFADSLNLTGKGSLDAPITVRFAPGRYDFYPDKQQRRRYDISNCNDDSAKEKNIAVLIENAAQICIVGPGACIVCRGKMIELCVDHSEAISVEGLSFDYHRPTVSEFTVTAVTDEYADLTVHQDSAYTVQDERILWQGEGWSYDTGLAQELVPETEEVWRRKDPLVGMRIEETQPFQIRAHGEHDMVAGRVFQLRNTFRDCCGVFMRRSKQVTLRDVNFFFMHGMGVLCQFTEDITLERVNIAPEEGRGRTTAAWADCTHFSGCRGKITLKDCLFCGAHDDATNVHGTHLRIVEQVDERQMKVRFVHRQTYGFMAFTPGDEIEFVRWDTLAAFGSNRVLEAEMTDPYELLLTLEQPVPDWRPDDVIENVTWTASVEITGCTAKRIPSRGFLLTTRQPVVVKDNTFVCLRIGIHVESDAEGWFESGCVRDMTIQGNRFLNSKRTAVRLSPHFSKPNSGVHRNVRILDNEIVVAEEGSAVEAEGCTGLVIRGNKMRTRSSVDPAGLILVTHCKDTEIGDNEIIGGNED